MRISMMAVRALVQHTRLEWNPAESVHMIEHMFTDHPMIQVLDQYGTLIQLPGVGKAPQSFKQTEKQLGSVHIPALHESYYPLMVVMTGPCEYK